MQTTRLIWLVVLAVASPAVNSCSGDKVEEAPVLRPVRAEQVFASGGGRARSFTGVAKAGVETRLSFKVPGTIDKLPAKLGQTVRRGQLIAEIDPGDYRLQVEDAEAALAQATASERNASANYERVRGLYENRNASKQDLDAARANFESATAFVESAQKRLEIYVRQLGYTRLTAPIDAAIASVDVEVNENVNAGQTIALLTGESSIEVQVAVPGRLIASIREGQVVSVSFDALPGRELPARLTEVGVASTGATTYPVTARLDEMDSEVRSGMSAEVTVDFAGQGQADGYLVPSVSVGEDREGRFVYVVEPKGDGTATVRRREVTIGDISNQGIEVSFGLNDGEWVVTAGVSKIVDGQTVKFEVAGQ